MKIISIDPASAKKQAYAIFIDNNLTKVGSCKITELQDILANSNYILTERIYVNPTLNGNFQTAIKLSKTVGVIEYLANLQGAVFAEIMPAHWKKYFKLCSMHKQPKFYVEQLKNACEIRFPEVKFDSHDEMEAALIGWYWFSKNMSVLYSGGMNADL